MRLAALFTAAFLLLAGTTAGGKKVAGLGAAIDKAEALVNGLLK